MNRRLLTIFLVLLTFTINNVPMDGKEKSGSVWLTEMDSARKLAESEKRPIMAFFTGSDWCVWCKRLNNNVLSKQAFAKFAAENLVLLKLDFPRRQPLSTDQQEHNVNLMQSYGVRGLPTVVLINHSGRELARTGFKYLSAKGYVDHLKKLLKKEGIIGK